MTGEHKIGVEKVKQVGGIQISFVRASSMFLGLGGSSRPADRAVTARHGALSVLTQQAVESLLLANGQLAGLNAGVVDTEQRIDVVHRLRADIRELLDLRGDVLDLVVGEREAELLDTALDGVPAREPVADRDVAREAEVLGLEDLVCRGVVEDRLGVDAGLVRERAVATEKT